MRYRSCSGRRLVLRVHDLCDRCDAATGVADDAWWAIECERLPVRALRLQRGVHSLNALLRRYAFLDRTGCVHHKFATAEYGPGAPAREGVPPCVPDALVNAPGVTQFFPTSGNCWYSALCTVSFATPEVRDFLLAAMPADMARLARSALFSREAALGLRKKLWYDYAIGDDVDADPSLDGRNGASEWLVMCAKLGIPVRRYREEGGQLVPCTSAVSDRKGKRHHLRAPRKGEPYLLVMRFVDGEHSRRFPVQRRMLCSGDRCRLFGIFAGHRKCGHQIGVAFQRNGRNITWGDADLHKDGIGMMHVCHDGPAEEFPAVMREITHLTKYGPENNEICNFSTWNEHDALLDAQRGGKGRATPFKEGSSSGTLSLDLLYHYDPSHP